MTRRLPSVCHPCGHGLWGMVLLSAALCTPAQARELKFCVPDRAAPPWTYVERDGLAQQLLRKAVQEQGDTVEFIPLPWRRCLMNAQSGLVDGPLLASPNERNNAFLSFPKKAGKPNPALGVGEDRYVVVTRKDSHVTWDGKAFTGLSMPPVYPAGVRTVEDKFAQLGIPAQGAISRSEQVPEILLAQRAQVGILRDATAHLLLAQPSYKDALHVLPMPLVVDDNYAPFTQKFTRENPGYAQAVWRSIGKIRNTQDWKKRVQAQAQN